MGGENGAAAGAGDENGDRVGEGGNANGDEVMILISFMNGKIWIRCMNLFLRANSNAGA